MDHYCTIYGNLPRVKRAIIGAIQHPNPTHTDIQRALSKYRSLSLAAGQPQYLAVISQDVGPTYVHTIVFPEYSQLCK